MLRWLMYWRFHIAIVITALAIIGQAVLFFYVSSWYWKALYLSSLVFSIKALYNQVGWMRWLNELRKQADEELPDGAIVFEEV